MLLSGIEGLPRRMEKVKVKDSSMGSASRIIYFSSFTKTQRPRVSKRAIWPELLRDFVLLQTGTYNADLERLVCSRTEPVATAHPWNLAQNQ